MQSLISTFNKSRGAPDIVVDCVEFIKSYGMDREGIFRISTDALVYQSTQTRMRKDSLRKDDPSQAPSLAIGDLGPTTNAKAALSEDELLVLHSIDEVAAALKMFFLDLEEPLVTFAAYEKVRTATLALQARQYNLSRWRIMVNNALQSMPEEHKCTLFYMLDFLEDVGDHSEFNKMPVSNLSVVFGPVFLRSKEPITDISTMMQESNIVQIAVSHIINEFAHTADEVAPPVPPRPAVLHETAPAAASTKVEAPAQPTVDVAPAANLAPPVDEVKPPALPPKPVTGLTDVVATKAVEAPPQTVVEKTFSTDSESQPAVMRISSAETYAYGEDPPYLLPLRVKKSLEPPMSPELSRLLKPTKASKNNEAVIKARLENREQAKAQFTHIMKIYTGRTV